MGEIRPRVKTILYEPIAPYFSNAYNTIVSFVQGIALSSLFFVINRQIVAKDFDKLCILKIIIVFLVICVIWHRYITHNQYLVWRIGVLDTIIPMVMALLQMLLALSVGCDRTLYFSLTFTFLCFWGSIAYVNAIFKYNKPESLELYKEHFCEEGENFANDLLQAVKNFEKFALYSCVIITVIFTIITLFIHLTDLSEQTYSLVSCVACFIVLILQFCINLENKLKSTDELKKIFK